MDWPVRSLMFIPAHKSEWVQKVQKYSPDAIVLDLEDAVAPQHKPSARKGVRDLLSHLHQHDIGAFVRINALEEGGKADLDAIVHKDLDGVILPKAATVDQVRELDGLLTYFEGREGLPRGAISILLLPETAEGMQNAEKLASQTPRVKGIVGALLGTGAAGDFATALGIWPSDSAFEQVYIASKLSLDSRAAGAMFPIAVVNGVQIDDLDKVRQLTRRAKEFGYTGVLVIHPTHLTIVNEVFAPSETEIQYYRGILEKMKDADQNGDGAFRYQGEMIDFAMIARAKQMVRDADKAAARRTSIASGT